jgi:hypothetical protein
MVGHGSKFGRKKEAAINALLTHRNMEEAASAVGVSKSTLARWQKKPDFQSAFLEARKAAIAHGNGRLQYGYGAAASTLMKIMLDPSSPASVRMRAAESVMDRAKQGIEEEDTDPRITALEQKNAERCKESDVQEPEAA